MNRLYRVNIPRIAMKERLKTTRARYFPQTILRLETGEEYSRKMDPSLYSLLMIPIVRSGK